MKKLTFSYDDGITEDLRLVEIFNKYGMKATFNLNSGIQTYDDHFTINDVEIHRMNQKGLKELYAGHEIASHGLRHLSISEMTSEEVDEEVKSDMNNHEKIYGKRPVGFAYPYGAYSDSAVANLSRLGIKYARTVESSHDFYFAGDLLKYKPTCHHNDEKLFDLAEQFLKLDSDKDAVFYVWGHSYEFDVDKNWDRIEDLCKLLSEKNDIMYCTNSQAFGIN